MFKPMGKKISTILRLIFFYLNLWRERGEEKEREKKREREERVGEREREKREETSSYTTLFIWKYDTFVTHSWGSLKCY